MSELLCIVSNLDKAACLRIIFNTSGVDIHTCAPPVSPAAIHIGVLRTP
jgi:hypothetical protein